MQQLVDADRQSMLAELRELQKQINTATRQLSEEQESHRQDAHRHEDQMTKLQFDLKQYS